LAATETTETCKRELQIEVPADVVAREMATLLEKYQRLARLPGFRRGKVPPTIIKQRFAEELKSEVVETLVPKFFREEVQKQKLMPVSQPQVTDLHIQEGEPLRFKAAFEVLPDFKVSGYDNVKVAKADVTVTDDDVERTVQRLREQAATYTDIQGSALSDGDFAEVSFTGTTKDATADQKPITVDEILVEIGGENTVKEFSENLRGAKPGDQRTFDVNYAADFADARLAGKTIGYAVTVKAVKQKNLPALDDAFAKTLAEDIPTVEALRQRIRQQMEEEKKHHAEHEAKDKIMEALVSAHDFPVPEALIERQIDIRLERGLRALAGQGMREADMRKMDFPRLRAGQRDAAVRDVKSSLILDRIADQEHIEVSDEELAKDLEALARQSRQPVEALRARLTREGALDRMKDRIRSEKTLAFLYQRSA
jgi:trigger factor